MDDETRKLLVDFLDNVIDHFYQRDLDEFFEKFKRNTNEKTQDIIYINTLKYGIQNFVTHKRVLRPVFVEEFEVIKNLIQTKTEDMVREYYDHLLKIVIDFEVKEKRKFDYNRYTRLLEVLDLGRKELDKFILEKPTQLLFLLRNLRPKTFFELEGYHLKPEYEDKYLPTAQWAVVLYLGKGDYVPLRRHYYCYRDYPRNLIRVDISNYKFGAYHTVVCFKHFKTTKRLKRTPYSLIFVDSVVDPYSGWDVDRYLVPELSKLGFEFSYYPGNDEWEDEY